MLSRPFVFLVTIQRENNVMIGEAAAAIADAVKASGAIVSVEPNSFSTIVSKGNDLLVVVAEGGVFSKNYQ